MLLHFGRPSLEARRNFSKTQNAAPVLHFKRHRNIPPKRGGIQSRAMPKAQDDHRFAAINAAKQAGAVDLVTETDKRCEEIIFRGLQEAFPDHKFIGEEGSAGQGFTDELTDEPTWMVDPVDGTTNFVHGFPQCCVSIALCIKRKVVLGVVFNPVLEELFVAERGKGATLNGRGIAVSKTTSLQSALFATEIGVSRDPATVNAVFSRVRALCEKTRSVRAIGSCALDMCYVACGRLDFMYEIGFGGCWDCAAGSLMVQEAGGRVLDPQGGPFDLMSRRVLAGNAHVPQLAAKIIAEQPIGPLEPGVAS